MVSEQGRSRKEEIQAIRFPYIPGLPPQHYPTSRRRQAISISEQVALPAALTIARRTEPKDSRNCHRRKTGDYLRFGNSHGWKTLRTPEQFARLLDSRGERPEFN